MSVETSASHSGTAGAMPAAWSGASISLFASLAVGLFAALMAFYGTFYSVHTDLAGILLSSRLALTLGSAFADYSVYFPPAERAWYSASVWLSDLTGLRLDLAAIAMTCIAVLFSVGLAFHIRRITVGASPLFVVGSVVLLVILPILYKNVVGLREHLVVLGLWPYLVLRVSDPDCSKVGWKLRVVLGLWLGATLMMKYLYSLVVLLVELGDAAIQRKPMMLFRVENVISGAIVALYLFFWLVIDPAQREVIGVVADAIGANLATQRANMEQAAIHISLSLFFLLLAYIYKLPARISVIGVAMVVAAIIASWIQSRWYTHHLYPITMAYIAWVWMIHRDVKLLWVVAVSVLFVRPVVGEFVATSPYQRSVNELQAAMDKANLSVTGKRVGLLNMHPSPFNQYLAMNGGIRWISSMNNSYVASESKHFDRRENAGQTAPPVELEDPGIQMLHDEMLRLWEDRPPEVLILDESTSWPLQHVDVDWKQAFAGDERFEAILGQYRPVFRHEGDMLDFTVYERAN